jgi:beta-lactamase regulating signal transducer with metallopeptidase domain
MIAVVERLNSLGQSWATLVWALAWQSALVVAAFAVVALAMRRSAPALGYWLWQLAAIKMLVMPIWIVSIPLWTRPALDAIPRAEPTVAAALGAASGSQRGLAKMRQRHPATTDPRSGSPGGALNERLQVDWRAWLMIGWAVVVAVQIAAIGRQWRLLAQMLRQAAPAADGALLALVAELCDLIGLQRPPRVLIVEGDGSPFVCGAWRPAMVLPEQLVRSIDRDPLRAVLLHELAHIKRRDLLWDWIPTTARLLYFFHPAAHFIFHRGRLERELACDQAAMILTGQGAAGYAATLVDVVSRSPAPLAVTASAGLSGERLRPGPISTSTITTF